jgi:hypothetical protein
VENPSHAIRQQAVGIHRDYISNRRIFKPKTKHFGQINSVAQWYRDRPMGKPPIQESDSD